MEGKSLNIKEEKLEQLKQVLPEVFSEGKVDWEKLQATIGENINFSNERYVLNWAGKSDAFKALQTPSTKTLVPTKEESVNFEETENIFIEGENLEVLKVLQKSYFGKVKMIYIDPPYNTGNDSFIYPDRFSESKADYQRRVGDKDEEGYLTKEGMFSKNSRENGQYHSNWLNMMYPRLHLAKNLLRQDGVIFVSIDDHEVHNLRLLMNEVFGEENFVGTFVWQSKKGGGSDSSSIVTDHEYVLCFSKSVDSRLSRIEIQAEELDQEDEHGPYRRGRELNKWGSNSRRIDRPTMWFPIKHPNGDEVYPIRNDGEDGCWRFGKKKMDEFVKNNNVDFVRRTNGTYTVYEKIRSKDIRHKPYRTFMKTMDTTAEGSKVVKSLFDDRRLFDFPKPLLLAEHLIKIGSTSKSDLILDFFSGSGTIAHATMALNKEEGGKRKYICVQLPEETDEKSEAYKAGFTTIADIAKERIRRAIQQVGNEIEQAITQKEAEAKELENKLQLEDKDSLLMKLHEEIENLKAQDLGFKVLKLTDSNFKQWRQQEIPTIEDLERQMELFVDPVAQNTETEVMLYELLLKSGKDLNSRIKQKGNLILVNDNELAILLEEVDQKTVETLLQERPQKVIALDRLFEGNDQLKTNTMLQMKDAGIEFKTI